MTGMEETAHDPLTRRSREAACVMHHEAGTDHQEVHATWDYQNFHQGLSAWKSSIKGMSVSGGINSCERAWSTTV